MCILWTSSVIVWLWQTNFIYWATYSNPNADKETNKPLNEGKRLPRQYCAILSRFRPASVNRSQAAVESLAQLQHRLVQTAEPPHETWQCKDVVIASTTKHNTYTHIHRESKKGATLTMAITLSILDWFANSSTAAKSSKFPPVQNPRYVTHHTLSMLLHYLGKLENQKYALCMHVKHVSSVIFFIENGRFW